MSEKKPIREIVKDPSWQKVRAGLVGKWIKEPEWCCKQVADWLGPVDRAMNDQLRIVMNYYTGTGFRTGKIKHVCISTMRAYVSIEIRKRKQKVKWY